MTTPGAPWWQGPATTWPHLPGARARHLAGLDGRSVTGLVARGIIAAAIAASALVPGAGSAASASPAAAGSDSETTRAGAAPTFAQVRAAWRPSDALLLDRHGEPLARLRIDHAARRLDWVALEEVSPALRAAVIASEDHRFWQHAGIDWGAMAAAAARTAGGSRARGASTLTMQLAGLIDESLRHRAGGRSLAQKAGQGWLALRIERGWTKAQILEAWLNLVPFRGELVGVDAMARTLFGKRPDALDAHESAIAAASVRAPNAPADAVARRACAVLRLSEPAAGCDLLRAETELALARRAAPTDPGERLAPHLAHRLLVAPGERVRSTLDARLQRLAIDAVGRHLAALRAQRVEDAAAIVLDNASGETLAWVGSSGARSSAPQVDHALAPRQAGSTLKPFVYALAIESGRLTAASIVEDAPLALPAGAGLYVPQNYDRGFRGPVTVRTALGSSLNVPAVRTLQLVGADALLERLRHLGLQGLRSSGEWYGPSLALGSADVTLAGLANAYRTLANGGVVSPVRWRLDTPAGSNAPAGARRVLDATAAFVVADILADRGARAATFGLDNALATRFWSAVKTGTSKDMRDNWCIGFTTRHTVAVWVGNASGAPMHAVSGVSGAAPIWADLMRALAGDAPPPAPVPPAGLVRRAVAFAGGLAATRSEWFLAGTDVGSIAAAPADATQTAIAAPVAGTIVALDPDMPPSVQRLGLQATGERAARAVWTIDGAPVGRGERVDWLPMPGSHRIALSVDGQAVDAVRIEVRGALLRPAPSPHGYVPARTGHAPGPPGPAGPGCRRLSAACGGVRP